MIRAIATKKSFVNAKLVGASMSTLVPRPTFKPKYDNYINGKVGIVFSMLECRGKVALVTH
jgi:hypothetical protein